MIFTDQVLLFVAVPTMFFAFYTARRSAGHGIERIDLLKVDVEGAELQVLRGAVRMLRARRIGCVTFEFGQTTFDMGNSPAAIEALFDDVGYLLTNIVAGDPPFPGRESVTSARFAMMVARPG